MNCEMQISDTTYLAASVLAVLLVNSPILEV